MSLYTSMVSNYGYKGENKMWYETKEDNEVIFFVGQDGERKSVSDWIIFSQSEDLFITIFNTNEYPFDEKIFDKSPIIPVGAGAEWINSQLEIQGMIINNPKGTKLRWIGNY